METRGLGQRVKALRLSKEMSVKDLARMSTLSRNMIWKIEVGDASPSLAALNRIATALGVTAAELLEEGSDDVAA